MKPQHDLGKKLAKVYLESLKGFPSINPKKLTKNKIKQIKSDMRVAKLARGVK